MPFIMLQGLARHHWGGRCNLLRLSWRMSSCRARDRVERLAAETEHHIDAGREENQQVGDGR